jgi:hypothetical protein
MSPRVYSWPERPEPFRVIVYTQFKDNTKSIELDIPSNSTVEDSYKLIASTAKEYTLDFCKGSLDGKELTLALGHCKVSCRSVDQSAPDPDKRAPAPYEMKLENWKDWSAITSIIVNWESMGYQDISVVITRIIEVTTPKKIIDNDPPLWLYEELINVPQKLPNTGVTFIPKAEIERLTSIDVIRNVINHENDSHEDDRESLIEYIHQDGKVLFLLVVKMDLSLRVLQEAKNEEFNDKCLPVKTSDGLEAPWIKDKKTRLRWKTNLDKWQWDFHAASFTRSSRNSKFDSRIVVPYTSKEVRGKGAFSIVYAVSLEESHQKIYELPAIVSLFYEEYTESS